MEMQRLRSSSMGSLLCFLPTTTTRMPMMVEALSGRTLCGMKPSLTWDGATVFWWHFCTWRAGGERGSRAGAVGRGLFSHSSLSAEVKADPWELQKQLVLWNTLLEVSKLKDLKLKFAIEDAALFLLNVEHFYANPVTIRQHTDDSGNCMKVQNREREREILNPCSKGAERSRTGTETRDIWKETSSWLLS